MKDQDKFIIKDLAQDEDDKKKAKNLKRARLSSGLLVAGEDMGDDTSDEEGVSGLRKRVKDHKHG